MVIIEEPSGHIENDTVQHQRQHEYNAMIQQQPEHVEDDIIEEHLENNDDDDIIAQQPANGQNDIMDEPVKKKSRKAQPETWSQNIRKSQRERGEQYQGSKKIDGTKQKCVKNGRNMKERCTCKNVKRKDGKDSSRQCADLTEEDRKDIFNNIWTNMNWHERKVYVKGSVDKIEVARKRTNSDDSRRGVTYNYYLKKDGIRKPVCQKMYLATTSLGKWSVQNWASGDLKRKAAPKSKYYQRSSEDREFILLRIFQQAP
jgi:hypothetical protein